MRTIKNDLNFWFIYLGSIVLSAVLAMAVFAAPITRPECAVSASDPSGPTRKTLLPPEPTPQEWAVIPPAVSTPQATTTTTKQLKGLASWFWTTPGHAAAGPKLRALLGPHWRGHKVEVCATRCITVILDDWCQCYRNTKSERVIDLSGADFKALAPLSRGILKVSITP